MQIRPRKLILSIAAALACASLAQAEGLRLTSNVIWSKPDPWFGGFSGMEISADGNTAYLITDRSSLVRARLIRKAGQITAIQTLSRKPLTYHSGQPLRNNAADSEALAIAADGSAYVSFEHDHRVGRLNLETGAATRLPDHPDFAGFPRNSGLEALAVRPDGTLVAIPESSASQRGGFPIYSFDGRQWRITRHIPPRGPFRPVGADFDAEGLLYLAERTVTPLGFRSRIRRFDLAAPDLGETTLLTTLPGRFDNLESLSVWRDPAGNTRITMIADDNFLRIQRTQIVEFILTK
ncbi:hypothetical protein A8B82_19775 [Sulfitobacter sp. EhC04]|uniref:esterase-like activity of phytase family protein n=1 Tax=Sulfitobacter sp. EhC04 TaxID=1849168 RepID=UPI0007F3FF51|nr:esterase-like activity of phytase family protein [Sulfitobacter sp. EhC04]OAN72911.1 hypothetical protein A8B82_19775 [Sulfitobacter sp. EhC04]